MNHLALTLLLVSTAGLAAAEETDPGLVIPHSDWRAAVAAPYHVDGPAKAAAPAAVAARSPTDDPSVVKLPPFVVRDTPINTAGLHTAIVQSETAAQNADLAAKFGIAVHEVDVGRVKFHVATILFIPFEFGLSW